MTEHAETIAFRPRQRRTQARVKRRRRQLAERRPARVARRLVLAHRIAADIEAGRYKDYADVARHRAHPAPGACQPVLGGSAGGVGRAAAGTIARAAVRVVISQYDFFMLT